MYTWDKSNKIRDKYKQPHFENDPKINKLPTQTHLKDEKNPKMTTLQRACMVEKWMDGKIVSSTRTAKSSSSTSSKRTTLLDEFDVQDTLFFSTNSKTEYSVFFHSRSSKKKSPSFQTPPIPKPIQTRPKLQPLLDDHVRGIESRYLQQLKQTNDDDHMVTTRTRVKNIYSNIKSLKQPISPGVRLSRFISSLFVKEGKKDRVNKKECRSEQASTCSSASSFSRSCLSKNNSPSRRKFHDGVKPTAIFNDYGNNERDRMSSKVVRSISKRFEKEKNLEEVALDLLNGYWDQELNKTSKLSKNGGDIKVNDGDYDVNYGLNYVQDDGGEDEEEDGFSCSSSDLFELDHLSLIGDELPVYETTRFNTKIM